ncbi:uncharacterized protein [Apostichopus japonicus]|uniref:uncharacterized protein n=1 Tax=Stichopus japonicus TaxID=307972 RepID=UPI003AB6C5E8
MNGTVVCDHVTGCQCEVGYIGVQCERLKGIEESGNRTVLLATLIPSVLMVLMALTAFILWRIKGNWERKRKQIDSIKDGKCFQSNACVNKGGDNIYGDAH